MEYAVIDYRENDLVRLDILIAGEPAPPLAAIVHRDAAFNMVRHARTATRSPPTPTPLPQP